MDGSFYGAVTVLAAVGYLGLVWVHRAGASEGAFSLSSRLGQAVLLLVLALHGASLLPNWFSREGLQFGFAVSISWTLWLTVLLLWVESWFQRLPPITRGIFLVATAAVVLPLFFPGRLLTSAVDGLFRAHLLLAMLAYSTFTLAAASALMMIAMEKALHQTKNFSIDKPGWWQGLPPLIGLDQMLVRVVFIGFVLITFTLISGVIVSLNRGYGWLRFDHKTVFTMLSWCAALTLLLGHRWWGWRGRVAARWTLAGFLALLMAYVGSSFVLEVVLKRS
ncbi:MAG: cytochrome C assembly family protein [Burkholderiaceae bacterium]